ncbi:hypothetical protein MRX96_031495 [Rhipicephalus microplus]
MKRSQSGARETAQDDRSRRNNDAQKRISDQFPEPSTNVTRRSFAQEGTIRPEYSPDEAIITRHTSAETSRALHSVHRLEEPRHPRYAQHKFTSSMASSPPARPCPSNMTEEIIVWSGIAKHRLTSPENEVRRRSYEKTKQATALAAPEDLEHYLEDVYDESQSRKLPKQETPGRLSMASEKRGRYNGFTPSAWDRVSATTRSCSRLRVRAVKTQGFFADASAATHRSSGSKHDQQITDHVGSLSNSTPTCSNLAIVNGTTSRRQGQRIFNCGVYLTRHSARRWQNEGC